jgi:vacuolar-type H+-ATPase subunit I/STV1
MDSGLISIDFLNNWDITTTISELLVGLYFIFISEQNPNSSYDNDIAYLYKTNRTEFERRAKEFVKKYASPSEEVLNIFQEISENEIKELKVKLNKANKIIEKLKLENQDLANQINSFKNINTPTKYLQNEIKKKDELINQLMQKLQNNNNYHLNNINKNIPKNKIDIEDMRCVTFITPDQSLFYGISCSGNDIFAEVEEKLYKEYPEYRETNNTFLANGKEILRFKTINDNKIGSGKPIMLIKPS